MTDDIINNEITANQLFCSLVLTRLAVVMGTESVSPVKFLIQLAVTALLCIIAIKIPPTKAVGIFCCTICIFLSVMDFYRVYLLIEREVQNVLPPYIVTALLLLAALYSYFAGMNAVARSSPIFLITVSLFLLTAVICSLKAFHPELSALKGIEFEIPYTELDIPVLYILLSQSVKGDKRKSLFNSVAVSYAAAFIISAACILSMGKAVRYSEFPVLSLFQLEGLGSALNLDVLFSSAYLISVFFRISILLGACKRSRVRFKAIGSGE